MIAGTARVSSQTTTILLVDDDEAFRSSTAALLRDEGHRTIEAVDGQSATEILARASVDIILMDMRMPGIDGIDLVEVLRTRGETTPILMISGFGTVDSAVRALHVGADDFLTKPVEPSVLIERVDQLIERRPGFESDSHRFGLAGKSDAMAKVLKEVTTVGPTEATVLITGETGTGKELVARAIHQASNRTENPFVPVNCAAFAEGVLESELFGHTRGAFTGAIKDNPGFFKAADRGTLFLDEVGDLSEAPQKRLLRALQEREVTPVGSAIPVSVDVRVVAATNQQLEARIADGRFREDLYYRLNVFRIRVPPLRERAEDIPILVEYFLRQRGASAAIISPLATRILSRFPWPGNVRQLFAALESAWVRAGGNEGPIRAEHLPEEVRNADEFANGMGLSNRFGKGAGPLDLSAYSGNARYRNATAPADEREAIVQALEDANGVRAQAARVLGMGRTTLWRKMKEHGLVEEEDGE